jgi:hypothetical protein
MRMTQKHSVWLRNITPCDVVAFNLACEHFCGKSTELAGIQVFLTCIAAVLKWPPFIQAFVEVIQEAQSLTPRMLYDALVASTMKHNKTDCEYMHKQISRGRMRAMHGVPAVLKAFGMIEKVGHARSDAFSFGDSGKLTRYAWTRVSSGDVPSPLKIAFGVAKARDPIQVPQTNSSEVTVPFARNLMKFITTVPHLTSSDPGSYSAKHVVRKFLLWKEDTMPHITDSWTRKELEEFFPDEKGYLKTLTGDETTPTNELREAIGVPGTMISCWGCLFGQIKETDKARFEREPRNAVFKLAMTLKTENADMSPCPAFLTDNFT